MATTSDTAKTAAKETSATATAAFYLAVMLEDGLAKGHTAAFQTVGDLLQGAESKKWTPALFMRCGGDALTPGFAERAAELLELEPAAAELLKAQYGSAYARRVLETAPEKLSSGLTNWIEEAQKRKGALLAASLLPEETAHALFAKMRLNTNGFVYETLPNNDQIPLAKRFVRWARRLQVAPTRIVMIAHGPVVARAALEAGFQCVAVPDELTAFADFSGCQFVLDQYGDVPAGELFDTLFPMLAGQGKL